MLVCHPERKRRIWYWFDQSAQVDEELVCHPERKRRISYPVVSDSRGVYPEQSEWAQNDKRLNFLYSPNGLMEQNIFESVGLKDLSARHCC